MEIQENDSPHFRITIWPGSVLAVPSVTVFSCTLLADPNLEERFLQFGAGDPGVHDIRLPEEFFLRELFELDLSDVDQIVKFSEAYGRLGVGGWKDLPATEEGLESNAYPRLREIDGLKEYYLAGHELDRFDKYHLAPISELVEHAAILRDMVRMWLSLKDVISFEEVVSRWENRAWMPPESKKGAAFSLENYLNAGLRPFHAHITTIAPKSQGEDCPLPRFHHASLYSAVCLQLYNHIAENVTYRRCRNETCGQVFFRQRGRAEIGFYKTKGNIFYCSKHCAKAQAQRGLRRRQGEAKRLFKSGEPIDSIAERLESDPTAVRRWLSKTKLKEG